MTIRILEDVEEAIEREIRRITFSDNRNISKTVLEESFDPFTGEAINKSIEPSFFDSSADTRHIQYPYFYIKLLRTREDIYTKRAVPVWGKPNTTFLKSSSKAFEIIEQGSDGIIDTTGNTLKTSILKIRKIQAGQLLRILTGNNIGTYKIQSVNLSSGGQHDIIVSNVIKDNLPNTFFNSDSRELTFLETIDLNTVETGDEFEDASTNTFTINSVDIEANSITLGGSTTPDVSAGSKINRPGDVFDQTDSTTVSFIVMDPTKPITSGSSNVMDKRTKTDYAVPLDLFHLIRIDSKERGNHRDVLVRMWEEFNPPRTGLPVITRTRNSTDQLLQEDIPSGGSKEIKVEDSSEYNVNDKIFLINDFTPTKSSDGGFQTPFTSKIVGLKSGNVLELEDTVPDSFDTSKCTKVVSNADFNLYMFHFVDHNTRDNEPAQYWVHEFTFWTQVWVDRQGEPTKIDSIVQRISPKTEIL